MDERVTDLEKLAETLAPIPGEMATLTVRVGDVESQIVQLRTEVRDGFSAVRGEISVQHGETTSLRGEMTGVRREMTGLREDIAALGRETAERFIQFGAEMRTLFEESIGRRKVVAEGNPPPDA